MADEKTEEVRTNAAGRVLYPWEVEGSAPAAPSDPPTAPEPDPEPAPEVPDAPSSRRDSRR